MPNESKNQSPFREVRVRTTLVLTTTWDSLVDTQPFDPNGEGITDEAVIERWGNHVRDNADEFADAAIAFVHVEAI
jgi:hypothetical protein